MKILQVIPYFIPAHSYGGPVKVCYDLSIELIKRGHELTVATTDTLDGKNRILNLNEVINGIKIIRFKNLSNSLAKKYNAYTPIGFYFWIKKNISYFDVVYCHDFFTIQNIIVSHFCKKFNIKYIIQPHGCLSPIRQNSGSTRAKLVFLCLFGNVLKNADHIIALTDIEKQELIFIRGELSKKIVVIPNGLNLSEFNDLGRVDVHDKFKISKDKLIIGFIGRIQYIKGIDISLEILSQIKNQLSFAYLIIGPDEGEKNKLTKKIIDLKLQDHVVFTGLLENKEKLETIKSCDVFLFTSRNEGLPLSVLEVAAIGIPQILSKNCNIPEIARSGAGYEIDIENHNLFRDKLINLLSNKELRQNLSDNARLMVRTYFDLKVICDKIEKLIKC